MRTLLPIFVLALCASVPASGQAIRFDSTATTTSAQCVSGKQCPLLVLPGTQVNFCQGTPSTLSACLASPATTYRDASAGVACATTAQLTPGTGGSCRATADTEGGYGAWFLPGSYGYYLRVPVTAGGGTYGPYALSIHGDSGGYTFDSLYSTLAQACTAAGAGTLAITRAWNATPSQTLNCSALFFGDGKIQTATSAAIVFGGGFTCPATQQCLDSSTNPGGSFSWTKDPPSFYPQWWGAVCDGVSDDRVYVQAAIDGTRRGTLGLPATQCAVSSPGLYLYPANDGMTISGASTMPQSGLAGGGGLIATATSPPDALLTSFSRNTRFNNMYLDGNARRATVGLVSAGGLNAFWENVTTRRFAGDGAQVNNYATPLVAITAGGTVGSSVVTVASVTNNRLTFGSYSCAKIMFGYGTGNQEEFGISSVSGSAITLVDLSGGGTGHLAHTHTQAQCGLNSNTMHVTHYSSHENGGWGWRILPGSDINAIWFENGYSSANVSGGELWCGVGHKHYGGDYQGDTGPAVQLGDVSGSCVTHYSIFAPLGDVEEVSPTNNVVRSVCDDFSRVEYSLPDLFKVETSGACPVYVAVDGSTTIGYGAQNGTDVAGLSIKNAGGSIAIRPGSNTFPGGGQITFMDTAGATLGTFGLGTLTAALGSSKPVTDYLHAQLEASGGLASLSQCYFCKLLLGYRTDTNEGFIQANKMGVAYEPILLNPNGGAVILGTPMSVVALGALPSCRVGDRQFVVDSNSATFNAIVNVVTTGPNVVPVYCDASHVWRVG